MVDVNRAWNKLYTRLNDENLLIPDDTKMVVIPRMRMVAAIALLCICVGVAALFLFPDNETAMLVSLHNNETSNTLVSTLNDGSIVYLTDGATLTYPENFSSDKRQVNLQGEALFDIYSNKDCPFFIETESVVVEVLGTAFSIKSTGKSSFELSVLRGKVKATLKENGIQTLVESGETVLLNTDHQLLKKWLTGQPFDHYTEKMRFKDERLDHIINVINRISDTPVVLSDDSPAGMELTITFDNNSPTDMVELICRGFNLSHSEENGIIVIAPPKP